MRELRRHEILAGILATTDGLDHLRHQFRERFAFGWTFARICESLRLPYVATAKAIGYDQGRRRWIKPPPPPPNGAWQDDEGYWHVPATSDGKSIRFNCPACKKEHLHGDDGEAETHRISHCFHKESPLHSSNAPKGYFLHIHANDSI